MFFKTNRYQESEPMVTIIHKHIDLGFYSDDGRTHDAIWICAEEWWNDDHYDRDFELDVIKNQTNNDYVNKSKPLNKW